MIAVIGLMLSVIAAGVWSGLFLTVTTILHPMFVRQSVRGFVMDMSRFLPIARRSPTNHIPAILLLAGPTLALIGLSGSPAGPPFLLTAAGLAASLAGPVLTSRYLSEPTYDVILSWDPDAPPDDWRAVQRRWIRLNWTRGALTWLAFALFLLASYTHLTS